MFQCFLAIRMLERVYKFLKINEDILGFQNLNDYQGIRILWQVSFPGSSVDRKCIIMLDTSICENFSILICVISRLLSIVDAMLCMLNCL